MASEWQTALHGGERYKVLDDHAGNLTVTEWREQAEEYAEHVCDATGLELLKGIAPKNVTMLDIYRSVTPFVLIKLAVLILCMSVPDLVTWLPDKLMN